MKNLLSILALACLLHLPAIAQVIEWQNTIGGNLYDQISSISQTSDGGYICGGFSNSDSSGDKTENSSGLEDYWIVKLDALGNIQWQNTIGANSNDELINISQTAEGGYICGGSTYSDSSGDKTEHSLGGYDNWVIKLDALGNIQWQNTIGGAADDYLVGISQTYDGGYICGSMSNSYMSGDKTENGQGAFDYWVIKLDSLGNIQWQNTIGGSNYDYFRSISQTSDGGYICGGSSTSDSTGDKTENSLGIRDYWVVKLDSSGNIQWQNTFGGNSSDELMAISQTSDGGYICGGHSGSDSTGDKTENSQSSTIDYWVVKLDSLGNIQWQNTIGGNSTDQLISIFQTSDEGYICGGYSYSDSSGDKTGYALGLYDYWVLKLDSLGYIQWQNTIGGNYHDYLYSISQTSDGNYICGGSSQSNISGNKTENSLGGFDYWVVKLTGDYNSITGKLFIDVNSNQVPDSGEAVITNKTVTETNTGRFTFSDQNGNYNVSVLDSGMFTVYPQGINYYNAVPINHTAQFTGINQTDSLNDFAYQASGVFNDLCVQITPISRFRLGFNALYNVTYENVGTTTLNPTVIFFPDSAVSFVSSIPSANSVASDSVVWNFGPLSPFQKGSIRVTVNVDAALAIGAKIYSIARIEPVANDANTSCNYAGWDIFATASIDPNEILVDRDTVYTSELSNPPALEYIINFQNTGNDTAFTVRVLDPIDTSMLDLNTFEFVASSHPVNIKYIEWENNLEFRFDNILLADSGINEPASHGFVRYRIKPKQALAVGDSIRNTAYIYFDFNQPVQTNTAVTEIVMPTSINDLNSAVNGLRVYPNPSSQNITVQVNHIRSQNSTLVIFDLFGRKVWETALDKKLSKVNIDVSHFSDGIYFIELQSPEGALRAKFVKQ